jgi:hypothetical protein
MKNVALLLVLLGALLACGNSEISEIENAEFKNGKGGRCRDEYLRMRVHDDKVRCGWPEAVGELRVVGVDTVVFCRCPRSPTLGVKDGGGG